LDDQRSTYKEWINQFETYTQTNHKRTVIHDINAAEIDKKQLDGWFVPTMPDLNLKKSVDFKIPHSKCDLVD
jgi:hypothetical protein